MPLLLATLVFLAQALNAQQWSIQYSYQDGREMLRFADLVFPTPQRGVAVGTIQDQVDLRRSRHIALLTSNGGVTWDDVKLEEEPVSLFFLDASRGWMVTTRGIWSSEDAGRKWAQLSTHSPGAILRVWFLDASHGFAVGRQKRVLETSDGGATWIPVPAAAEPAADPGNASYTHIAFADAQRGLIAGSSVPPAREDQPRQVPTLTLQLQTLDGGKTWSASTAPLFGQVAGMKLAGDRGLLLFSYSRTFQWPSEVYRLDLRNGRTESVFREAEVRILDLALFGNQQAFLAGIYPRESITPTQIRIYTTSGLTQWTEMRVDPRAKARKVLLAGSDPEHMWAATDTGIILRLER